MLKLKIVFFLTLILLTILSVQVSAQTIPVKLVRSKGTVEVKNSKSKEFLSVNPVLALSPGDTIRTLENAKAQITFPNEIVLLLGQKSLLKLNFLDDKGSAKINIKSGSFLADLKKALQEGSTFEVRTRDALAVVRGTIFEGSVDNNTSTFRGYQGTVLVYSLSKPNEPPIELQPGMMVEVDINGNVASKPNDKPIEQVLNQFNIDSSEANKEEAERSFDELVQEEEKKSSQPADEKAKQEEINRLANNIETIDSLQASPTQSADDLFLYNIYNDLAKAKVNFDKAFDSNDFVTATNIFISLKSKFDQVASKFSINDSSQTNKSSILNKVIGLINYFKNKMQLILSNPDKALEETPGSINNVATNLYVPNTAKDSDLDGVDDSTETLIGSNPNFNNNKTGFFKTQFPLNNSKLFLEKDNPIQFKSEALKTKQAVKYELIIEDKTGKLIFKSQLQDQPNFVWDAKNAITDTKLEIIWYVNAYLTNNTEPSIPIPSQKNDLTIFKQTGPTQPPLQGTIILVGNPKTIKLTNNSLSTANFENDYIVDVNFANFTSIKSAKMIIEYDPSILEFKRGHGIDHFDNTIVFSGGNDKTGRIPLSGQKAINSQYKVANNGSLFRLYFKVIYQKNNPISTFVTAKNVEVTGANDETVYPQVTGEILLIN